MLSWVLEAQPSCGFDVLPPLPHGSVHPPGLSQPPRGWLIATAAAPTPHGPPTVSTPEPKLWCGVPSTRVSRPALVRHPHTQGGRALRVAWPFPLMKWDEIPPPRLLFHTVPEQCYQGFLGK